jgi:hypothetical protein
MKNNETINSGSRDTAATGDPIAEIAVRLPVTPFERATIRLAAFSALKGWGAVRDNGKFSEWNGDELKDAAERYAGWALRDGMGHLYCDFCGKHQTQVRKLVAGPAVFACDECIKLMADIIASDDTLRSPAANSPSNADGVVP